MYGNHTHTAHSTPSHRSWERLSSSSPHLSLMQDLPQSIRIQQISPKSHCVCVSGGGGEIKIEKNFKIISIYNRICHTFRRHTWLEATPPLHTHTHTRTLLMETTPPPHTHTATLLMETTPPPHTHLVLSGLIEERDFSKSTRVLLSSGETQR